MNRKIVRLSLFVLCLVLCVLAIGDRAEAYPCEEGARIYGESSGCCPDGYGYYWRARDVYVCQDGLWVYEGPECTWQLC